LAFYGTLGLFPALLASVSLYGLVADPIAIQHAIANIAQSLPAAGRDVVSGELAQFVARSSRSLSLSLFLGVLAVLWSSSSAMGALVRAINVAYDLPERRNFWQRRRLAVLFTLGGMLGMFVLMPVVAVLPKVLAFFHVSGVMTLLRWPAMALGAWLTLGFLYRYSAERSPLPTVRAVLPGATVAAALWVLLCAGYSAYVQYFTSFSSTYGALTGVVVLQFWLYISALIVVYGAELNAELERGAFAGEQQELPLERPTALDKTATPR
jgi:membrane protein